MIALARTLILGSLAVALTVLASAGRVRAAGDANGVPLYDRGAILGCIAGGDATDTTDGFVNFEFTGDAVHVAVDLMDAQPDASYTVDFYGPDCTPFLTLGEVSTNNNGYGFGMFEAQTDVSGGFLWVHIGQDADYAFTPFVSP